MKKPGILFIFFLAGLTVFAQKAAVSALADRNAIRIGEPLQLRLEATSSKPHTPSFFTIDSIAHFEILSRSKVDTVIANNQTTLTQTLTLTSWDSGAWLIPSFFTAGEKDIKTKPFSVAVAYAPMPPGQDYHDIKDIVDVAKPPRETWYWYVIGAAILLLLGLLLFPKTKKSPEAVVMLLREGAYKTALKNLGVLKAKSGLDSKEFFTELILIFRTYLQQAKGIHSFQQTTDELHAPLQGLQLPHEDLKKLMATLQLSDVVKFAQYNATREEQDAAWTEIQQAITAIEQPKT